MIYIVVPRKLIKFESPTITPDWCSSSKMIMVNWSCPNISDICFANFGFGFYVGPIHRTNCKNDVLTLSDSTNR